MNDKKELVDLTARIVSAYVGNNVVALPDMPILISDVHKALERASFSEKNNGDKANSVVPIRKSVTPDYIICLEDGGKFKSLKRHIRTQYGLSPEQYREKWGLPRDYPMVAPNYANARSELAKKIHLGKKRKKNKNNPNNGMEKTQAKK